MCTAWLQAKALGVSTAVCGTFGVVAWFAIKQSGIEIKGTSEVSSESALELIQGQRVCPLVAVSQLIVE